MLEHFLKQTDLKLILDISSIKIVGKNKKYSRLGGLSEEYKAFKNQIYYFCKKLSIEPPYIIVIELTMPHDIDGPLSAIIDGIQGKAFKNDKDIELLIVQRIKGKKGKLGNIKAWSGTIKK